MAHRIASLKGKGRDVVTQQERVLSSLHYGVTGGPRARATCSGSRVDGWLPRRRAFICDSGSQKRATQYTCVRRCLCSLSLRRSSFALTPRIEFERKVVGGKEGLVTGRRVADIDRRREEPTSGRPLGLTLGARLQFAETKRRL